MPLFGLTAKVTVERMRGIAMRAPTAERAIARTACIARIARPVCNGRRGTLGVQALCRRPLADRAAADSVRRDPRRGLRDASAGMLGKGKDAAKTSAPPDAVARTNLTNMGGAFRRIGWACFWVQFSLTIIAAVMTTFAILFQRPQNLASSFSFSMVLAGVVCGFFSTYWAFGYIQLSKQMRRSVKDLAKAPQKASVLRTVSVGLSSNVIGIATTLLGLQAVVGFLVAKTLANATANPFLAGGAGSYSPVLALDVFLVQAATNCLLSHFISMCVNMYLQRRLRSV